MQDSDASGCDIMLVGRQVSRAISAREPKETHRRLVLPGLCKPRSLSREPATNTPKVISGKVLENSDTAESVRPHLRHREAIAASRDAKVAVGAPGRLIGGANTHTAAFRLAVLSVSQNPGRPRSDSDAARADWPLPAAAQTKAACLRREYARTRRNPDDPPADRAGSESRPARNPTTSQAREPEAASDPRPDLGQPMLSVAAATAKMLCSRDLVIAGEPVVQIHRPGVFVRSAC
jgi:hypothetical protein